MVFRKKEQPSTPVHSAKDSYPAFINSNSKEREMAEESRKPNQGIPTDVNAYFGKGSKFSGKLSFEGTIRVDGAVEGEILSKDVLIVGEGADIKADIKVHTVYISGSVEGDIIAKKRLEIRPPGRVYGSVKTTSLLIQEGAIFEGHCSMGTRTHTAEAKPQPSEREAPAVQA